MYDEWWNFIRRDLGIVAEGTWIRKADQVIQFTINAIWNLSLAVDEIWR